MAADESRGFKAVLFDLYDTLVWLDVERSNQGRREMAARAGVPLEQFTAVWRRSVNDRMEGRGNGLAGHLRDTLSGLGREASPKLIAELVEIERRRLEESVHLYPATGPVLQKLARRGYRLGLVSNVSDGAAIPISHLGLDKLFHEMILSHEVGILKPDPAIFILSLERLGVRPAEAVFVADGGFGELDASHNLGIYSVLIEQAHQSKDYGFSSRYDLKITNLRELLDILPGSASDA